jgi:uncharacterized alkaline shock family protein YloU
MKAVYETRENTVRISEGVVALIVESAADGVEGVYSLKKARLPFGNLFSQSGKPPAVDIAVRDGAVGITVSVIVTYNCNAKKVAELVQTKVKNDVQNMTGLAVACVNVVIDSISFEEEKRLERLLEDTL